MALDLRISTPEVYYNQLDHPQTAQSNIARRGLVKVLNLDPNPGWRDVSWYDISSCMIEASNTVLKEERDLIGISSRIVGLMRQYPWLQGFMRYEDEGAPISVKDLDQWAGNHVFDDYPGLFGITQHESHIFRGAFHGGSNPTLVNQAVQLLEIAE